MLAIRKKAAQCVARPGGYGTIARYATGTHGKEGENAQHHAGKSTEHEHHHAGPKTESLGIQLYIVLAVIPASYAVYLLSRTSEDGSKPGLSRLIDSYSYYKDRWAARNTLHTAMIEQAAFDRNLFQSSNGTAHVDLKFPEIFNQSSPWNVPAGQGGANLDKLVAHYQQKNVDEAERKAKASADEESSK